MVKQVTPMMKTLNGRLLPRNARGVLYICDFDYEKLTIKVNRVLLYKKQGHALHAYANIPNPPSQLTTGSTYEELCTNLTILHKNMQDKTWLTDLSKTL